MPWIPDCLDRFLGWTKGSPQTSAATGFYLLRIVFGTITVHSGIIFAGIITYEAMKLTNCLPDSEDSCQGSDDDPNDGPCRRLWGIIRPSSLFPILGTGAAIVLALSAAIVGTAMDVTQYRRQISYFGNLMCCVGLLFCASIVTPNSTTIAVSTAGLFIVLIFKDFNLLSMEAYAPELSLERSEVSTAITTGYFWLMTTNIVITLFWVIIGLGMSESTFGLVVSIGTSLFVSILSTVCYRRLPDVPPSHQLPEGSTIVSFTFTRFKALIIETYNEYFDLGVILLAGMIFDPALVSIFAASVLFMISEYNFTAEQTRIILAVGIIGAIPGGPAARWVASTPLLNCCESEAEKKMALEADRAALASVSNVSTTSHGSDNNKNTNKGGDVEMTQPQQLTNVGETPAGTPVAAGETANKSEEESENMHPRRMLNALRGSLFAVIVITLLAPVIMQPCNVGAAMIVCLLWAFSLSFTWSFYGMLRMSIVPGGREAEFSGLNLALFSALIWLPLLVFSVANETWSIVGAMYLLNIFFGVGIIILFFVNIDRALEAQRRSLGYRRYASGKLSAGSSKVFAGEEEAAAAGV